MCRWPNTLGQGRTWGVARAYKLVPRRAEPRRTSGGKPWRTFEVYPPAVSAIIAAARHERVVHYAFTVRCERGIGLTWRAQTCWPASPALARDLCSDPATHFVLNLFGEDMKRLLHQRQGDPFTGAAMMRITIAALRNDVEVAWLATREPLRIELRRVGPAL